MQSFFNWMNNGLQIVYKMFTYSFKLLWKIWRNQMQTLLQFNSTQKKKLMDQGRSWIVFFKILDSFISIRNCLISFSNQRLIHAESFYFVKNSFNLTICILSNNSIFFCNLTTYVLECNPIYCYQYPMRVIFFFDFLSITQLCNILKYRNT